MSFCDLCQLANRAKSEKKKITIAEPLTSTQPQRKEPQKKETTVVEPGKTTSLTETAHSEKSTAVMVGPNFRMGQRLGRGNFGEVRIGNCTVSLCLLPCCPS